MLNFFNRRLWREHTFKNEQFPQKDSVSPVDAKRLHGGSADCCFACEDSPTPSKMNRPSLAARIKKTHDLSCDWIYPREVRPLVAVAETADESQVIGFSASAMLPGQDMIDLNRDLRESFREITVLAFVTGCFP